MPWQEQVVNVGLEIEPSTRLPAYREIRVSVPRRSGKTTLFLCIQVDRSLGWGRHQRTLYTAQDRQNSREKWEEQNELLRDSNLAGLFKIRRMNGMERTIWEPTKSTVGITSSSETAGHGFDIDLAQVDEAWAQKDNRLVQAFRPAMMCRPAAQIWITSTMGTEESLFWNDLVDDGRARVEAGETRGVAYFEWSASTDDDPDDPRTWWGCMPALGHTVSEEVIQADHDSMDPGEFARAYLNQRTAGGRPVIDAASWAACRDSRSQLAGLPCFSVDVTPLRDAASIAVAGWRSDRKRHIEIVDHRPGTDWVIPRLVELQRKWQPWPTIVDPGSPAGSLMVDLAAAGVQTNTVTAREYAQACGQFYDAVVEGQVRHLEQPVLNLAVFAARKRPLGDAWAWARKTGGDISPLVAVTLSHYGLVKSGTGNVQIL
jgi:phage terminase large subunit-like protein